MGHASSRAFRADPHATRASSAEQTIREKWAALNSVARRAVAVELFAGHPELQSCDCLSQNDDKAKCLCEAVGRPCTSKCLCRPRPYGLAPSTSMTDRKAAPINGTTTLLAGNQTVAGQSGDPDVMRAWIQLLAPTTSLTESKALINGINEVNGITTLLAANKVVGGSRDPDVMRAWIQSWLDQRPAEPSSDQKAGDAASTRTDTEEKDVKMNPPGGTAAACLITTTSLAKEEGSDCTRQTLRVFDPAWLRPHSSLAFVGRRGSGIDRVLIQVLTWMKDRHGIDRGVIVGDQPEEPFSQLGADHVTDESQLRQSDLLKRLTTNQRPDTAMYAVISSPARSFYGSDALKRLVRESSRFHCLTCYHSGYIIDVPERSSVDWWFVAVCSINESRRTAEAIGVSSDVLSSLPPNTIVAIPGAKYHRNDLRTPVFLFEAQHE